MADWSLRFDPGGVGGSEHRRSIDDFSRVIASVVDGQVTALYGELDGNPRDFYSQAVTLTGARGPIIVEALALIGLRGANDPEAAVQNVKLALTGDVYTAKLAIANALRDAFVADAWRDESAGYGSAPIIDDADAAGDTATANVWRNAMTKALVAEMARASSWVTLASPRVDVEPILAAHPAPKSVTNLTLHDCRFTTLPTQLARFTNLEALSLWDALDASVLRPLALPHLHELTFFSTALQRLDKRDLAGFPSLRILTVAATPLAVLDPEIVEVCPQLARVFVFNTPLWRDAPAMAKLRARWPRVYWNDEPVPTIAPSPVAKPPPPPIIVPAPPVIVPPPPPARFVPNEIDPTWRPYLDAILAAPDDDAPRLAFADFLVAHGDKRGEHIRAACEDANRDPRDSQRGHLQAMLQFTFFSDTRYPFLGIPWNRRGFVETIECTIDEFIAHADVLFADGPIRVYVAKPAPLAEGVRLASCAALGKLRGLSLSYVDEDARAAILASPHLGQLRELTVKVQLATAADVARLAEELRPLASLRMLELRGRIDEPAIAALIELVKTRELARLDVSYALEPSSLIARLWEALGERVHPGRLPSLSFENGELSIDTSIYAIEQLRELFASTTYRSATRLSFGRTNRGDALVKLLAPSGAFPLLTLLVVGGAQVTDASAYTLASQAIDLDALEEIDLGGPAHYEDRAMVSDDAVAALVNSTRLPALRRITRSIEHHVYNDSNATETDEVKELRRPDGSIVQSVVYHSIWP